MTAQVWAQGVLAGAVLGVLVGIVLGLLVSWLLGGVR